MACSCARFVVLQLNLAEIELAHQIKKPTSRKAGWFRENRLGNT
jgi:hypothetical protein